MNILVCVKQVPDTTEIKIDPVKHTLIREGVPSIVNPFDACALELAVRLKEKEGGNVYVVSMGPAQAKIALKECLSVGADQAFLVTDHATLATAVEMRDGKLRVTVDTDEGYDILEMAVPALVTVTKTTFDPRRPSIKGKMMANRAVITEITNEDPDMDCDQTRLGLKGSPTKVKKTFTPNQTKNGVLIQGETDVDSAVKLAAVLSAARII